MSYPELWHFNMTFLRSFLVVQHISVQWSGSHGNTATAHDRHREACGMPCMQLGPHAKGRVSDGCCCCCFTVG